MKLSDHAVTIIVALIGVIGVVVTAIITYHEHKKQGWNDTVGRERITWLKSFREELGKIMLAWEIIERGGNQSDLNLLKEAEEARYVLISRLNTNSYTGNEYNYRFKEMLFSFRFLNGWTAPAFTKEEFMRYANLILEQEWAKIKKETRYNED